MKKFKCIDTNAILLVNSRDIIKQLMKSDKYEEIKETAKKETTKKEN